MTTIAAMPRSPEPWTCRCRSARTSTARRPCCRPLAAGACDYVMPDVARIGGVTGWMQAAGIAAAYGIEMSSHLMPEISVHLLAASSRAHWLEYVDWADAILEQPLELVDGHAVPPDRPGLGMVWDERKLSLLEAL